MSKRKAGKSISRSQLVTETAHALNIRKAQAKEVIDYFLDLVGGHVVDYEDRVTLTGVGTFSVEGERGSKAIRFEPSKGWKDRLNPKRGKR